MSAAEREDAARALFYLTLAGLDGVSWRRADAWVRVFFRNLVDERRAA